jgi:hypothetical protein
MEEPSAAQRQRPQRRVEPPDPVRYCRSAAGSASGSWCRRGGVSRARAGRIVAAERGAVNEAFAEATGSRSTAVLTAIARSVPGELGDVLVAQVRRG